MPGSSENPAAPDIHPSTHHRASRPVGCTVKIKGRNRPLLVIVDAEEAYILVPYWRFSIRWPNLDAKEALGQSEQTVEDARQRKIRPQLFVVKIIALRKRSAKRQIPVAQVLGLGGTGSAGTVLEVFQVMLAAVNDAWRSSSRKRSTVATSGAICWRG